nr:Stk1 family PASTA domain-containing Ser/Thr kinase [Actinomycetota bacterium]
MSDGPDEQVPAPRVFGGRYEVGELIGRGGMAEVHVGHDLRLGRSVAIKILRADLARDSSFLARFRREAQSAAGLNHPSIVAVYDSGEQEAQESGGGSVAVPYIVMEHVEGHTLRDLLNEERVLDPDEAARITAAVLAGLDYAHAKGIVHRDIKPANVMMTRGGAVKVMDFGIARALADTAATMTQTQAVLGTARYLSPEQAQGQDVDARSDLYSTGCLLYELLTGRTPFQGDPVSLVYQHLGETPKAPSQHQDDLPPALDAITLHALEKTPDGRYQSARAFRDDLVAARTAAPISAGAQASHARIAGAAATTAAGVDQTDPEQTQVVLASGHRADTGGRRGVAAGATPPGAAQDGYEDTGELPVREERHRGGFLMLTALALLALGAIAFVVFQVLGPGATEEAPPEATVPFLLQMTQEQAQDRLDEAGLVGRFTQQANEADEGEVVEQDPGANTTVEKGSTVQLVVSAGPDSITIPNVEGFEEQPARTALEAERIRVADDTQETNDLDFEEGEVVSTRPGIGEDVSPEQEVVLVLASGQTQVPDVVGDDIDDAVVQLRDGRLDPVTTTEVTDEVAEGTVLEQSIDPGEEVDYDTEITLVVAQAPPETVTDTETATVTETTPTTEPSQS